MYRTRTEPRTSCLLSFLHWSQMESSLNLPFRKSVRSYSQSLRPISRFIKFSPQHKSLIVSFPQQPWGKPWPCAISARQPFLPWLCVVSLSAESMIKDCFLLTGLSDLLSCLHHFTLVSVFFLAGGVCHYTLKGKRNRFVERC